MGRFTPEAKFHSKGKEGPKKNLKKSSAEKNKPGVNGRENQNQNPDRQVLIKKLQQLHKIVGGSDVIKREALATAIVDVSAEYGGLGPDDILQWINAVHDIGFIAEPKSTYSQGVNIPSNARMITSDKSGMFPSKTPEGGKQAEKLHSFLLNVLDGQKVDYSTLSSKEKAYLVAYFGELGQAGYDPVRRKDIFSGETIPLNEFMKKMRQREYVKSITKKYSSLPKNAENASKMLDELSKTLGIGHAELKDVWDKSKNTDDFANSINLKYFKSGVCRDITVFQAKLANDMGLKDTFVTTASTNGTGHVVGGYRDEKGNIVFFNYGELVATDTPNMKMALATIEKFLGSVSLTYLQSKGGEEGSNLVNVGSQASQTLSEIARGTADRPDKAHADMFNRGGLENVKDKAIYSVERNKVNVEVSVENLGGSMVISSRSVQPQSGANAIAEVNSLRLAQEYGGKYFAGGLAGAIAHISLKADRPEDRKQLNNFLVNLYLKTHKKIKLTEHLEYQISAMVDAIVDIGLGKKVSFASADFEIATGQRLSYIAPDLSLYVGMQTLHSIVPENIQRAGFNPSVLTMTNDILAANVGADVKLGTFKGHKVRIAPQVQVGKTHSGLATEYQGDVKLEAKGEKGSLYLKGHGKYVGSDDFRVANEARKEVAAGYVKPLGNNLLEIKGFAFQDTSFGKLKDPRLDAFGVGFQVDYMF